MESCLLNVQWQFYWGHKLGSMVSEHHLAYGYVGIGLKMYVLSLCVFIVLRINLLNNDTGTRKGKDM